MKILVCTDNMVGFLSAVYAAYYVHKDACFIVSESCQQNLFDEYILIAEDVELARKVRSGIKKVSGAAVYLEVEDAFRSCNPEKERIIFEFLKLLFKHGNAARHMYGEAAVVDFYDVARKVQNEIHRMHQFVRFQEMSNGVYYGFYGSDNDIIERVMPHFVQTYNIQAFILHDYKRKKIAVYDGHDTHFLLAPDGLTIELSESEVMFQSLWKTYHKTVTIKDRENLRLQRSWLPKKYRHFMSEF